MAIKFYKILINCNEINLQKLFTGKATTTALNDAVTQLNTALDGKQILSNFN